MAGASSPRSRRRRSRRRCRRGFDDANALPAALPVQSAERRRVPRRRACARARRSRATPRASSGRRRPRCGLSETARQGRSARRDATTAPPRSRVRPAQDAGGRRRVAAEQGFMKSVTTPTGCRKRGSFSGADAPDRCCTMHGQVRALRHRRADPRRYRVVPRQSLHAYRRFARQQDRRTSDRRLGEVADAVPWRRGVSIVRPCTAVRPTREGVSTHQARVRFAPRFVVRLATRSSGRCPAQHDLMTPTARSAATAARRAAGIRTTIVR